MRTHPRARPQSPDSGERRRRRPLLFAVLTLLATLLVPALAAPAAHAGIPTCDGQPVTVQIGQGELPTPGNDVILGTPGDDVIAAMGGNDTICGLGGNDTIWGQGGDDFISGGEGDDKLRGGADSDFLDGGPGVDELAGGTGDDFVLGGDGDDKLLRGGTGDDIVDGMNGNDVLVAGNGGEDLAIGGAGNDKVTGGPRPDIVVGDTGDDELKGNKGADFLDGGPGADTLLGGPQPDDLDGGPDQDTCNGGTTGNDALEDDNAINCETATNIEGDDVELPAGIGPFAPIGIANLGGPVTNPMPAEILSVVILESNPEQIQITFQGPPVGCFAADVFAFPIEMPDGTEVVILDLYIGDPVNPPDACATVLETHTMTIQLSEPLNGREVIVPQDLPVPDGLPGQPDTLDIGSLGPAIEMLPVGGEIDSFQLIPGTPDQIIVAFTAGPAECIAAESAAFGYPDRIELYLVVADQPGAADNSACAPGQPVSHQITIELSVPAGDRPIVTPPPLIIEGRSSLAMATMQAKAHALGR